MGLPTHLLAMPVLGLAALALGGCVGPNCQTSCFTLYDPQSQCSSDVAGQTAEAAISQCESECRNALQETGRIAGYNPQANQGPPYNVLINDAQAAAWMECIELTPCEDLARGGGCFPRLN